jgi:uncharacterized protein YbjT (DUF2867 family)
MKIVIIGGTGLIGTKVTAILRKEGHEVVAASPSTGVNTLTGEGLPDAMVATDVVIDLANSPSFDPAAVLEFFTISGRNLLPAEAAAGVRHHVALSVVGTDRMPDSGYFQAKLPQEQLIEGSGIPYTIVRATQFMEFIGSIAAAGADGDMVRLSPGLFQPIAADDVAAIVADTWPLERRATALSRSPARSVGRSQNLGPAFLRRWVIRARPSATRKPATSAVASRSNRWCRSGTRAFCTIHLEEWLRRQPKKA